MKPTQSRNTDSLKQPAGDNNLSPITGSCTLDVSAPRAVYLKPTLEHLGALNQIVRGASAKGVDCAGELDLATYPF